MGEPIRSLPSSSAGSARSRRFRAFADAHRQKIRKKLRTAHDPEAQSDVRAELLAAYLLLADRRIELAFEASGSTAGGPDFTVTYRATARFNVEVTRFRGGAASRTQGAPILGKLRQLPPSIANVLLIAIEHDARDPYDVAAVVRSLRARSEARDESLFTAHGLPGAAHSKSASAGSAPSFSGAKVRPPRLEPPCGAIRPLGSRSPNTRRGHALRA